MSVPFFSFYGRRYVLITVPKVFDESLPIFSGRTVLMFVVFFHHAVGFSSPALNGSPPILESRPGAGFLPRVRDAATHPPAA